MNIAIAAGVIWQRSEPPIVQYELASAAFVAPSCREGQRICTQLAQSSHTQHRTRQQSRDLTVIGTSMLATLAVSLVGFWGWQQAAKKRNLPLHTARIQSLSAYSRELSQSERPFTALVAALQAAQPLQTRQLRSDALNATTRLQLAAAFHDALGSVRERNQVDAHAGAVNAMAVYGNTIASVGADGGLQLWDTNGRLQRTLVAPVEGANLLAVAATPDGQTLVSGGADGSLRIWDAEGNVRARVTSDSAINSLAIAPDGQTIIAGTAAGGLEIYDANGRLERRVQAHHDGAETLAVTFSPDGKWLATASQDKSAKVFNRQGDWQASLLGHNGWVNAITFGVDSETITTASGDGTIVRWSRAGQSLSTIARPHNETVTGLAFSPDGRILATASRDRTIKFWDENGTLLQSFIGHTAAVNAVAFAPDGKTAIGASNDGRIKIWRPDGEQLPLLAAHPQEVTGLAFSSDGKLMASASWDGTIKLWNRAGDLLHTLEGHEGAVNSVAFAPDNLTLVSVGIDGTARFWNREGEQIRAVDAHSDWAAAVAFATDGEAVATAGWDGTIDLWNRGGELEQTFAIAPDLNAESEAETKPETKPAKTTANSVAFSPAGDFVAAGSSDR
ncbi:MAG: hypothetical protein AAFY11_14650, partial [Cyanobacteria bacterium J06641_5]